MKKKTTANLIMVLIIAALAVGGLFLAFRLKATDDTGLGSQYQIEELENNALIEDGQEKTCTITIVCDTIFDNLDSLEADTQVTLSIVWEELFKNMLKAKAEWLYTLKEWEPILSEDRRGEIKREFHLSQMAVSQKVGRNDPCPCGSGKKYKKCCGA